MLRIVDPFCGCCGIFLCLLKNYICTLSAPKSYDTLFIHGDICNCLPSLLYHMSLYATLVFFSFMWHPLFRPPFSMQIKYIQFIAQWGAMIIKQWWQICRYVRFYNTEAGTDEQTQGKLKSTSEDNFWISVIGPKPDGLRHNFFIFCFVFLVIKKRN